MRRAILIAALGFSGAVHAALVPEHLREMPLLGAAFIPAAAASITLAAALVLRPEQRLLPRAAVVLLFSELVVYLAVIAAHLEPVESVALLCKIVELVGLVAALRVPHPLRARIAVIAAIAGSAAGLLATSALAAPASMPMSSHPPDQTVTIPGRSYDPAQLIAVSRQTISWHNLDSTSHTVTADNSSFDSGPIPPGGSFSWTATSPGSYAYHCSIHHFMHGEIDVYELALAGPAHPVATGSSFRLRGLAQTAGTEVQLVNQNTGATIATAISSTDGSFTFTLTADTPALYRATAGMAVSPPYTLNLAARPTLTLENHAGDRYRLSATTAPPQPGAVAALQHYVPELFAWRTLQEQRLDAHSHATFALQSRHGTYLRLIITAAVNGYRGGISHQLRLP